MVAQINRKIGIEKIEKIGNLVLKNGRKTGKSIVLFSTKSKLLCSQDLDQLSEVIRRENDQ